MIIETLLLEFSRTSHGFYTAEHWKCTHEEEPGWYTNRFDDSPWQPSAVWPEGDFNYYGDAEYPTRFQTEAKFIWSSNDTFETIYCRARLCHGI